MAIIFKYLTALEEYLGHKRGAYVFVLYVIINSLSLYSGMVDSSRLGVGQGKWSEQFVLRNFRPGAHVRRAVVHAQGIYFITYRSTVIHPIIMV